MRNKNGGLNQQVIASCPPGGPIPHNMAKTFDGPPTLERSGSEHRRAVTSPLPEEEGLGEKVEPSLAKEGRGDSKKASFERRQVQSDTAMRNKYNFFQKIDRCNYL